MPNENEQPSSERGDIAQAPTNPRVNWFPMVQMLMNMIATSGGETAPAGLVVPGTTPAGQSVAAGGSGGGGLGVIMPLLQEILGQLRANNTGGGGGGDVPGPWGIGNKYLIRTVTMARIGKLVAVHPHELVLDQAGWVRFHQAIRDGSVSEFEPMGDGIIVGRGALVDAAIWNHDLPTEPISRRDG